jgi:aminoglycoside phosphotransferase family enzyme
MKREPRTDIQLIEAHSSWVVLAGAYAYKLGKPVDLGFLDFLRLERRVRDCAEEVDLNRRLSSDVYLGIVEVLERDGAYVLRGPGSGGEPALQMRRLPADGMLPALLARGRRRRAARAGTGFALPTPTFVLTPFAMAAVFGLTAPGGAWKGALSGADR